MCLSACEQGGGVFAEGGACAVVQGGGACTVVQGVCMHCEQGGRACEVACDA